MLMKRTLTYLVLPVLALAVSSAMLMKDSSGKAGFTGSPGESTCGAGGCHGGGSSAASGVTVSATPSFSNNEYIPGTTYNVTLTVGATGFTRFGFGCEILNSANANSGTMQTAGTGVKFVNAGNGRRNATHTTPKSGSNNQGVFTFQWVAPAAGDGDAVFYYCGNAVNFTGSTSGDLPIPGTYTVTEGVPTVTTGVNTNVATISKVSVFPNPASDNLTISYSLQQAQSVGIELYDLNGKQVKAFTAENTTPGSYEKTIGVKDLERGVYFVRLTSNGKKATQKMVVVN